MNAEAFTYDVFVSHSAKDKAVVRPLAEPVRLTVREHLTASFGELGGSALGRCVLRSPGAHA